VSSCRATNAKAYVILHDSAVRDPDLGLYVDGWKDPWSLFIDGNGNMRAICPTSPNVRPVVIPLPRQPRKQRSRKP